MIALPRTIVGSTPEFADALPHGSEGGLQGIEAVVVSWPVWVQTAALLGHCSVDVARLDRLHNSEGFPAAALLLKNTVARLQLGSNGPSPPDLAYTRACISLSSRPLHVSMGPPQPPKTSDRVSDGDFLFGNLLVRLPGHRRRAVRPGLVSHASVPPCQEGTI